MTNTLTLDHIKEALAGSAAAFRAVTEYQPAGGPGDKVFPPTYTEGNRQGAYATETRYSDGEEIPCVLLDSVQSQANRMELALLEEWEANRAPLPVITVDFADCGLPKPFRVTSLEAPHRVVDALLRDSVMNGIAFRKSELGKRLDGMDVRNATPLFEICPTALVFGMWDSTGEQGGAGVKFQRAMVSEIVGLHAVPGKRTSSRIDPAQILRNSGPVYKGRDGGWTLDERRALLEKEKPVKVGKKREGRPSDVNLGNVAPSIDPGGFTISKAVQTTVLSLPALRRLRFPLNGQPSSMQVNLAATAALAALALFAAALVRERGADLRSRCLLYPTGSFVWELLGRPGTTPVTFDLPVDAARQAYVNAVEEARAAGLPWLDKEAILKPSKELADLVRRSQEQAAEGEVDDAGGA